MGKPTTADYSVLDKPRILEFLFHPRPEFNPNPPGKSSQNIEIQVENNIQVGACFHMTKKTGTNILFFHGNGEIVADYHDLGPLYNDLDINFLAVDYRGYGRSSGQPSVSGMMKDCHTVYVFIRKWLENEGFTGPLIVMGRSLGSASALELAYHYEKDINGLIVESGFAYTAPLLKLLGIDPEAIGFKENSSFQNIEKIKTFKKPTLVIHAEKDHIIPYSDGKTLYEASPAGDKVLLKIPGANHNDIFMRGLSEYLSAVKALAGRVMQKVRQAPY